MADDEVVADGVIYLRQVRNDDFFSFFILDSFGDLFDQFFCFVNLYIIILNSRQIYAVFLYVTRKM